MALKFFFLLLALVQLSLSLPTSDSEPDDLCLNLSGSCLPCLEQESCSLLLDPVTEWYTCRPKSEVKEEQLNGELVLVTDPQCPGHAQTLPLDADLDEEEFDYSDDVTNSNNELALDYEEDVTSINEALRDPNFPTEAAEHSESESRNLSTEAPPSAEGKEVDPACPPPVETYVSSGLDYWMLFGGFFLGVGSSVLIQACFASCQKKKVQSNYNEPYRFDTWVNQ